jgi:hypothetical protein
MRVREQPGDEEPRAPGQHQKREVSGRVAPYGRFRGAVRREREKDLPDRALEERATDPGSSHRSDLPAGHLV